MDKLKSPPKPAMSFPTIKYTVNQDELEEIYTTNEVDKSSQLDVSEGTDKSSKKLDKAGPSILDKYLKAFKTDKNSEEDSRLDSAKEVSDKKQSDINEVSGSPIKEYFSKFHKRSDSVENSDADATRDLKDTSERWKLFSDFKVKIAQAVEDIKSSRTNEETNKPEKQNSVEDASDSEENSMHQELDPSMASTENQVSSISSSSHNLSDISLALSHSSTITDSEMESSSSDNNPLSATPTADKKEKTNFETTELIANEETMDEIESGVDALEDIELSKNVPSSTENKLDVTITKNSVKTVESNVKSVVESNNKEHSVFFTYNFIFSSVFVVLVLYAMPMFVMTNGVLMGLWLSSFFHKVYLSALNYLGHNQETVYDRSKYKTLTISKVPQIVEFEPLKKYEGWINIFSYKKYDPALYHISLTNTVYMKLEGSRLRLSYTYSKIPKRAMFDEKEHDAFFYQHKIYDLDGAHITLLPLGIVKKRHWSKKYPIGITIQDKSKITVVSHVESSPSDVTSKGGTNGRGRGSPGGGKEAPHSPKKSDDKQNLLEKHLDLDNQNKDKLDTPKKSIPKEKDILLDAKEKKSKERLKKFHMDDFMSDDSDDDELFKDPPLDNFQDFVDGSPKTKDDIQLVNRILSSDTPFTELHRHEISESGSMTLYIFCRTGREKAEWFKRLKSAIEEVKSHKQACESSNVEEGLGGGGGVEERGDVSEGEGADVGGDPGDSKARLGILKGEKKVQDSSDTSVLWTPGGTQASESLLAESFVPVQEVDFWKHMRNIVENKYYMSSTAEKSDIDKYLWLNSILGRIAFDTFRNPAWVMNLQERIQKKLSSIKLPTFMSPLLVSNLELGHESPLITDASAPTLDSRGLWVDLQLSYTGRATMTLTTQLNLMSLKERKDTVSSEESQEEQRVNPVGTPSHSTKRNNLAVYDSDLEDTAESSSEDEAYNISTSQIIRPVECPDVPQVNVANTPAKKLLRMVDKIAANKYFQHVTEYKYVKRAMEGVSKTDLKLNVELCELIGCFTINLPPSPSDRLWFGFRDSPHLVIKARPILGSRVINFGHITGWIEKKLIKEFEKVLVYPNLEDIIIDTMVPPPL